MAHRHGRRGIGLSSFRRGRTAARRARECVRFACEAVERRTLLSVPAPGELGVSFPAPPAFDWDIERRESARLTTGDGPEATSIVWTNRGQASDNFAAVFGTSAAAARNVVDAALNAWERVITNWNRWDGTTTLQVNISMSPDGGYGGAAAPEATPNLFDQKPRTGSISINRGNNSADPNDGNGYFLDPTPRDYSEFMGGIDNAFCGFPQAAVGVDLYSVVTIEMAHVLGLISDWHNNGGSWDGYRLETCGYATNTGVPDTAEGGGFGVYWVFDGPTVDHLMTSYNSGDPNATSWGNIVHTAGPGGNLNYASRTWRGADDTGNAIFGSERTLPDFVMAHVLADAYGYSIASPASFGTFYAGLNQSTGELRVRGPTGATGSSDTIVVSASGGTITVSVDCGVDVPGTGATPGAENLPAWVSTFNAADVTSIVIDGGDATDFLRIESNAGKPVYVTGGEGDDFIDFSYAAGNLDPITGPVTVNGGAGFDRIYVYDDYVPRACTYQIDNWAVTRPLFGGCTYGGDVEEIHLATGPHIDTVNVPSTWATTTVGITTRGGNDRVNLGNPTLGMGDIDAAVTIDNPSAFTAISIDDAADTSGDSAILTSNGVYASLSGLSPGTIWWKHADVGSVAIKLGSGADTLDVRRTQESLSIEGTSGNDVVNLGDAGSTAQLSGPGISIANVGSYTTVNVDNSAATAGQTIDLGYGDLDGVVFGILTGMAPATISYVYNDTNNVSLSCGTATDTVNIKASGGVGVTFISGGGGSDIVNVGDAGSLGRINATVRIANPPSFSNLNVDASADTAARSVTLSRAVIDSLDYGNLLGLAPAPIQYRYADTRDVTITTGTAADALRILATGGSGKTTVSSAGGTDAVTIGATFSGASEIAGTLFVQNPPSFSAVDIDDAQNAVARTVSLATITLDGFVYDRVTGLAPASIYLRTADVSSNVTLRAGTGDDTIYVRGLIATPRWTILAGGGSDTVQVGDTSNRVQPVDAPVTVDGGAGTDRLFVNDAGETATQNYAITTTTVAAGGMGEVSFAGMERLDLSGATAGGLSYFGVQGTLPATPVYLQPGNGQDDIDVFATSNPGGVRISPSGGSDYVNVNPDAVGTAEATLLGSHTLQILAILPGGRATVAANGASILRVADLQPSGVLDLADNAMIFDHNFLADMTTLVGQRLATGYNGGLWNGAQPSIVSSVAATGTRPNDALGYADVRDLFTSFPATFLGQGVDNSAVLVRYTLYGDANLDRVVNIGDFSALAANFNTTNRWSRGNFNYDALVNIGDFSLLAANFNQVVPGDLPPAARRTPFGAGRMIEDLLRETEVAAEAVVGMG